MGQSLIEESATKAVTLKKYLVFILNEAQYAVPLGDVREVIGLPNCVHVPGSPHYSLGLVNLRGKVINAIDLKKKIGVESAERTIKRPAVIITDCGSSTVGCVVDSILEVLTISNDQIEKGSEMAGQIPNEFIQGIARFESRPMILILALKNAVDPQPLEENVEKTTSAA